MFNSEMMKSCDERTQPFIVKDIGYCLPNHHIYNCEESISFQIEIEENNSIEDCTNDTKKS